MPHLWMSQDPPSWSILNLTQPVTLLSAADGVPLSPADDSLTVQAIRLVACPNEEHVLIAPRDVRIRINGDPLDTGIRALSDRDEIRVGPAGHLFYSTEAVAAVVPFPEDSMPCARCGDPIVKGEPAVRCPEPNCRAWHHQKPGLECWTFENTPCARCDRTTTLDGALRFRPEDL